MVKEIPARLVAFPCRLHGAAAHELPGSEGGRATSSTLRLDLVDRTCGY